MGSFSDNRFSKLKGIVTRSNNIQEVDRLQKKKQLMSEKEKSVARLQVMSSNYANRHFKRIEKFTEIASMPEEGEQIRIITQQQINTYTLILMIQQQFGIKQLYCTTYNFSSVAINLLTELLANGCERLTLVCNESLRQLMPARYLQLKEAHRNHNGRLRLAVIHNHTKIALIETQDNRFFVVEGSGNFSDNVKVEQYLFEQSKQAFNFHQSWIEHLFTDDYAMMKRDEILR